MQIVRDSLSIPELREMMGNYFEHLVKAVVDIRRGIVAVDAEMHADLEALLLDDGSQQSDLWGINLYPEQADDKFIEFDSMINIRSSDGNRSRGVDSPQRQAAIRAVVARRIVT